MIPDKGKLVSIGGGPFLTPEQARAHFEIMNQQEGSLGGGVESHEFGYLEAKQKKRTHDYYSVVFMIWPSRAEMQAGTAVASRKQAAKFGVKVPRGVDA